MSDYTCSDCGASVDGRCCIPHECPVDEARRVAGEADDRCDELEARCARLERLLLQVYGYTYFGIEDSDDDLVALTAEVHGS